MPDAINYYFKPKQIAVFKAECLVYQSLKRSRLNHWIDPGTVIYDHAFQRKGFL